MPSARQLLEQADALMRRNRKRGKGKGSGPPTLTDALDVDRSGSLAPTIILPEASPGAADPIDLRSLSVGRSGSALSGAPSTAADPIALDTLSDLPVLTDVVDAWSPAGTEPWPPVAPDADLAALGDALEADAMAVSADAREAEADRIAPAAPAADVPKVAFEAPGAAPAFEPAATVGAAPGIEAAPDEPPVQDEEFILDIPPPADASPTSDMAPTQAPAPVAAPVPALAPGSPAWEAMAEEIRMQVLQRLDLFTDTGMREQLGARLQPIVARASAELVETINQALGELVRGYVAEAIEREIETWRKRGG